MSAQELRPMGIGDILDTTFRLYRQRFLVFLLIALVVYLPFGVFMGVYEAMMPKPSPYAASTAYSSHQATDFRFQEHGRAVFPKADPQAAIMAGSVALVGIFLFMVVLVPLCSAALIENISASYLGETLSAGASYGRAAHRLLPLLWTEIIAGVATMVGYVFCIVPGVIFSLWFLLIAPVVVLERTNGSTAMGRSRQLMQGNLGKGFSLMLVVALLAFAVNFALGAVIGLVPWPHVALRAFVQNIVPAVLLPIQTAPAILLYYDLRIRKEAFDLQKLSEALGQPATT
ncbi:MAG: hypothetical protein ABFC96_01385 [Thermoguttaceae bacterium]